MTDLSATIKPKSDQLNSDDLIGGPRTIKITNVLLRAGDQPVAIRFEGDDNKPYLPCKSMRRVLVHVWGNDGKSYIGRYMTLFRDPSVIWGGLEVGGIRISHMSNITDPITLSLTATQKSRKPYVVKPLIIDNSLLDEGNKIASQGTDALKAWFTKLSSQDKVKIKPDMDKLKEEAAKYDQPVTEETEDEENP